MLQRHCFSFLDSPKSDGSAQPETIALIVLNAPIDPTDALFQNAWDNASLRVAADGGADRLATLSAATGRSYVPDAVVGDMDSASPAVLASLQAQGVDIVPVPDQDDTDLDKSINYITKTRGLGTLPPLSRAASSSSSSGSVLSAPVDAIVCHGAFGGRFDQQMSCLAALYSHCRALSPRSAVDTQTDARLVLLGDGNIAELLPPGAHTLHPPAWAPPRALPHAAPAARALEKGSQQQSQQQKDKEKKEEEEDEDDGSLEHSSSQEAAVNTQTSSSNKTCSYSCGFFPLNWAAPPALVVSAGFTWDLGSPRAQEALGRALGRALAKPAGDKAAGDKASQDKPAAHQGKVTAQQGKAIEGESGESSVRTLLSELVSAAPTSSGDESCPAMTVDALTAAAAAHGAAMALGGLVSTSNRIPAPGVTVGKAARTVGTTGTVGAALLTNQPLVFTASFGLEPRAM